MTGEKGEGLEKVYKSITFLCIVLTLIFILIVSFYAAKNDEGRACFGNKYMNTSGKATQNSDIYLDSTGNSWLQPYEITNTNNYDYHFCFSVESNETIGFRLQVVNENNTVLATTFAHNHTHKTCVDVEGEDLPHNGYIGLRCVSCQGNEQVILKEEILGQTVTQIQNDGTVEYRHDTTLDYELHSLEDCNGLITFFMRWYITLIAFISIGVLVFFGGYEKIRDGFF